jgi:membrane protein required for colicin V production
MARDCRLRTAVGELQPVDIVVSTILGIAILRGLFLGMIREVFSIGALGAACLAVKTLSDPVAAWMQSVGGGEIGPTIAPWLAGAVLAVGSIAAVVVIGRFAKRGARWAGLGWADRAGGAALGAAEGVLVVGILLVLAGTVLGRGHPALAGTRTIAALERLEQLAAGRAPGEIDVAAPPRQ